ncbi:NAD(P)H-dependent flavin oxidoreductase [Roseivirga sp. BDSF3-8]|uniref:NAD(P)H-dependent flavin oxidoreductase n=1 Tax=Roseivirga sp. BDSF3-8 TaxID=3241598 RepID=UPI003531F813
MKTPEDFAIPTELTRMLDIKYPVIMAPMFLVSNAAMVKAAGSAGITGAMPALNYRSISQLKEALRDMKENGDGPVGINLIVNKSNYKMREQLHACIDEGVDYFITSLGSPAEVIEESKREGVKVFCDVTDTAYATRVEDLGADALIAVNNEAGGHAGKLSPEELIPALREVCSIPVISAGGVGTGAGLDRMLKLGACGISMGSPFIATVESRVSDDYKQAVVDYGAGDIVMTTKLSGTPCTVINTPYVQEIGTSQNLLERILNSNKRLKKWAKMLTFYKGMKLLQNAAFSATYKSVWCAGPSIAHVNSIEPVAAVVDRIVNEYYQIRTASVIDTK